MSGSAHRRISITTGYNNTSNLYDFNGDASGGHYCGPLLDINGGQIWLASTIPGTASEAYPGEQERLLIHIAAYAHSEFNVDRCQTASSDTTLAYYDTG
jgi:hypothetical protein